ncbi:MAG: class I SAM-dependent methyltransferase [Leptospirales bacterium]
MTLPEKSSPPNTAKPRTPPDRDQGPASGQIYDAGRLRALFDEMSKTYGVVNFLSSFGFTRRWRKQCVALARLKPGDRVCDLMTGMGECWDEIQKRSGADAELVAVDFSPAMIAAARDRLPVYKNISVYEQDVFDPAFARAATSRSPQAGNAGSGVQAPGPGRDARFDAVVCCFGVKTLEPEMYPRLAELLSRLLNSGGRFAFVEISVPHPGLLRGPLLFYIKYMIPWIGRLCLGNPDNYRMLSVYTQAFGDSSRLYQSFVAAGLDVQYHRLFFGAATAVAGATAGARRSGGS